MPQRQSLQSVMHYCGKEKREREREKEREREREGKRERERRKEGNRRREREREREGEGEGEGKDHRKIMLATICNYLSLRVHDLFRDAVVYEG